MSKSKKTDESTLQPEIPTEVELPQEPKKTAEEVVIEREAEKVECEKSCKEFDAKIQEVNRKIAELRREKDALIADQDKLRVRIHELRPSPAEELQRHIRVQQQARAARTENITAAAKALAAAGVTPGPAPAAIDAAMKNRPRQNPNGAR